VADALRIWLTAGGSSLGRNHHLRQSDLALASTVRRLKSTLQIVDRQPAPALLPILRSRQQGEILALLLGDPDLELSLRKHAARPGQHRQPVLRRPS
jgi:hypothetical protein